MSTLYKFGIHIFQYILLNQVLSSFCEECNYKHIEQLVPRLNAQRSGHWRKVLTFSGQGSKKWCRRAQQPQLRNRNAHSCSLGSASMSAFVSTNRKLAGYWKAVSISLGNAGLECPELVISVGLPVPCSTCRSHRPQQTADHSVWYIFTRLTGSNFYQQEVL